MLTARDRLQDKIEGLDIRFLPGSDRVLAKI
jgi:DNA-binding response OmpR family regulator